uniref:Afadin n=1 Tax=Acrobeloides nanus TaxID=290746 RepID=A0A914ED39_9BILA
MLVEVSLPHNENRLNRSISDLRSINGTERVIPNDECPLMTLLSRSERASEVFFAVRQRTLNSTALAHQPAKTLVSSPSRNSTTESQYQQISNTSLPATLPVTYAYDPILVPLDTDKEVAEALIEIRPQVTEIGSDPSVQGIKLSGSLVHPKHCCLMFIDGVVTVTPLNAAAVVEVNGIRIERTLMLREGFVLAIGPHQFRFYLSRHQYMSQHPQLAKKNGTYGIPKSQSQPTELRSNNHIPIGTRFSSTANVSAMTPVADSAPQLPALIELYDQGVEHEFLRCLILETPQERFPFRPSPAFILYMVARYRISPLFRPGLNRNERQTYLQSFLMSILERFYHIVHLNSSNTGLLIFYLANISEFLHILKADLELASMSGPIIQGRYFELVEKTFDLLVGSCLTAIQSTMLGLLNNINISHHEATRDLLNYLEDTVRLIRKCRLNPALTIQVFSQLFYFVNMYLFNWLVTTTDGARFISRAFGVTLRERLNLINSWAEQQGLELAAECHMDRLQQTVNFLITPKTSEQIASLGATCYKLNSIQVRFLLENYVRDPTEMPITRDLIENVQNLAARQADIMAVQDGTKVQLEESPHLHLPFLLPQDGYVIETFRGISEDMSQFINSLQSKGICRSLPQPNATGSWTVHMHSLSNSSSQDRVAHVTGNNHFPSHDAPPSTNGHGRTTNFGVSDSPDSLLGGSKEILQHVTIQRPPGSGIGLSIVAAQGVGDKSVGIYVKSVVEGSPAFKDGRLESGDQLLSVNRQSLLDISQEQAAQKIANSGSSVHFEVAKHKAMSNGLQAWLQTTPTTPGSTKTLIPSSGLLPLPPTVTSNFATNGADSPTKYGDLHSPNAKQINPAHQSDQLYRHFRSNSASALMKDPVDTSSIASSTSHTPGYASLSNSRLPPHYRPASRPIVVQPSRPISPSNLRRAVSPTPLYTAPVRSASTIPFSNNTSLPSPPSYSMQQQERKNQLPHMTKSELNDELERLETKGPALTEADRQRYYQLISQLADFKTNFSVQSKPETDLNSNPNSARPNGRINTDIKHQVTIPSTSDIYKHKEDLISSVENLASRAMPSGDDRYLNACEANTSSSFNNRTLDNPSPLTSAIRTSPGEEKGRKRVTFNETKENEENHLYSVNNTPSTLMSDFERIAHDDDDGERVQTVGTHEVYMDPRKRRLNEIQARLRKPAVDGSNLAFRDKMKMFAAQIGEQMPKNRYKTSSTEREIEKETTLS